MEPPIQVSRRSVVAILLSLGSACAGFDARALDSAPGRHAPVSGREKEVRPEGTQSRGTRTTATRTGLASYYGKGLHGRKTASGEPFDKTEMGAAHPSYPLGTRVKVTNLANGRSQELRVIDRGPTPENRYRGVIIDVSEAAATRLGFRHKGKARVKVEVLEWGEKGQ